MAGRNFFLAGCLAREKGDTGMTSVSPLFARFTTSISNRKLCANGENAWVLAPRCIVRCPFGLSVAAAVAEERNSETYTK